MAKPFHFWMLIGLILMSPGCGSSGEGERTKPDADGIRRPEDQRRQKAGKSPFPSELEQAWRNIGANVGWFGEDPFGYPTFRQVGEEVKPDDLPALRLKGWDHAALAILPAPPMPFAL